MIATAVDKVHAALMAAVWVWPLTKSERVSILLCFKPLMDYRLRQNLDAASVFIVTTDIIQFVDFVVVLF